MFTHVFALHTIVCKGGIGNLPQVSGFSAGFSAIKSGFHFHFSESVTMLKQSVKIGFHHLKAHAHTSAFVEQLIGKSSL